MDLQEVLTLFNNVVSYALDSEESITESTVENVSNFFQNFSNFVLKDDEITPFLNCVIKYFVLLNHYSHCSKVAPVMQSTIRAALGRFLFVVDQAQLHQKIITKFRKVIDVIVENETPFQIKEFLRVYSQLLDKLPSDILKQVAAKHKSFPNLCRIIRNVPDVETQAIITEVILKLFKHGCGISLDESFLEILQTLDVASIDKSNIYQNIRMIIDQLNEFSTNIVSINCSMIEIDSCPVVEFHGSSNTDDIWLDINLLERKFSFFCDHKYASSIGEIKMYTSASTWEVLSFSANDVVKKCFKYNNRTHVLHISLLLNTASISLFATSKCDKLRNISISVSRYSERFYTLVEMILPSIFEDMFSVKSLNIPKKQESDTDGSSPVIEHFVRRQKKVSSVKKHATSTSNLVITLSDEENDSFLNESKIENTRRYEEQNISCITISDGECSEHSEIYRKNDLVITRRKPKIFVRRNRKSSSFNKSTSPLSFSDSVVGRKKVEQLKSSIIKKRTKISKLKSCDTTPEKDKMKISRVAVEKEQKIGKDISSDSNFFDQDTIVDDVFNKLILPSDMNDSTAKIPCSIQIKHVEIPELPKAENIENKAPELQDKQNSPDIANELIMDAQPFEISESVLNCSINKVQNWLEHRVEPRTPQLEETTVQNIEEKTPEIIPSISVQNTDQAMFVEERIELLMNGSHKNEEMTQIDRNFEVNNKNDHANTLEGLLKILSSQEVLSQGEKQSEQNQNDSDGDLLVSSSRDRLSGSVEEGKTTELSDHDKIISLNTSKTEVDAEAAKNPEVNNEIVGLSGDIADISKLEKIRKEGKAASDNDKIVSLSPSKLVDNAEVVHKTKYIDYDEIVTLSEYIANTSKSKKTTKVNKVTVSDHDNIVPFSTSKSEVSTKGLKIPIINNYDKIVTNKYITHPAKSEKTMDANKTAVSDDDITPDLDLTMNEVTNNFSLNKIEKPFNENAKKQTAKHKPVISSPREDRKRKKKTKSPINQTASGIQNISVMTDKPSKRKLYNPGDFSYLNDTIFEENLDFSKKGLNTTPLTPRPIEIYSGSSKVAKNTRRKYTKRENPRKEKSRISEKLKKDDFVKRKSQKKNKIKPTKTVEDLFKDLKDHIRASKKKSKMVKKLATGKKRLLSISSSSSMEPFGVAVRKSLEKTKSTEASSKGITRKIGENREEFSSSRSAISEKKINIISNILIKPARPLAPEEKNCLSEFVNLMAKSFLQGIMIVRACNPDLLASDDCSAIIDVLQDCAKQQ